MKKPDQRELEIIRDQLGREPESLGGIVKFCPFGNPAVLLTRPYDREKGVFPTTYWLSCPYLVKEVSRLEDEGLVSELTELLKSDQLFRRELEVAHRRYARRRFSLMDQNEIDYLKEESPAILKVLKESGVGGIRDNSGIKCLHTHLADFLVDGHNPVGRLVWQKLDWPDHCEMKRQEGEQSEDRSN